MSNPKRSDVATEADWTFVDAPGVMQGIKDAAFAIADEYPHGMGSEDLEQEACLHLAVRPEMVEDFWAEVDATGTARSLARYRFKLAMAQMTEPDVGRRESSIGIESVGEEGPSRWQLMNATW